MVSVIIINYNTPEMTMKAIRRFRQLEAGSYEIIFIDNNSDKKVPADFLRLNVQKIIQNTKNLGFAKAVNQGIRKAKGEFILLLNSDIILEKPILEELLAYFKDNPKVGIIGPRVLYPDKRFQPSYGRKLTFFSEFMRLSFLHKLLPGGTVLNKTWFNLTKINRTHPVGWVSGCFMLIRKKTLEQIEPLDEHYYFGLEDIDFCRRANEAGWQVIYYPKAGVIHYHGYSSGGRKSSFKFKLERKSLDYYFKKFYPGRNLLRKIIISLHGLTKR